MQAIIEIRRKADNVVRTIEPTTEYSDDVRWPDGLFLCDCNIGGLFAQAAGEPNPQDECGGEKYVVRITDRTGRVLYNDED
jgi:hypothetical protein